jgi:diaminopimelate epimerase
LHEVKPMTTPQTFRLVKAHAFGNDFLLLDRSAAADVDDLAALARRVCDRHRGLGADGLMVLDATANGASSVLWNADGSRAEVSGNGVRCAAAWIAHERALRPGGIVVIDTTAGAKRLSLLERDHLRLTFRADMGAPTELRHETLDVGGELVRCVVLRVGNPQCVVIGDATGERLHRLASRLAVHPYFPEGTNVELVDARDPQHLRILIWERGVGPTEASGTGACASAVAAAFAAGAARDVLVESPGGTQRVEWTAETIWLTGWAEIVGVAEFWA